MIELSVIEFTGALFATASGTAGFVAAWAWKFHKDVIKLLKDNNMLGKRIEKSVNGDLDDRFRDIIKDELNKHKHE